MNKLTKVLNNNETTENGIVVERILESKMLELALTGKMDEITNIHKRVEAGEAVLVKKEITGDTKGINLIGCLNASDLPSQNKSRTANPCEILEAIQEILQGNLSNVAIQHNLKESSNVFKDLKNTFVKNLIILGINSFNQDNSSIIKIIESDLSYKAIENELKELFSFREYKKEVIQDYFVIDEIKDQEQDEVKDEIEDEVKDEVKKGK